MKFKPSRAALIYDLVCTQAGQLIRGVKIEWSSVHGPGHPFAGGWESGPNNGAAGKTQGMLPPSNPNRALKAGVSVGPSGNKSTSRSGKKK